MKHKPTKKIQIQTQYAHIQKKNSNFTPTQSAAIDQPTKRNHQIDFEFFTTFLVLLTNILSLQIVIYY